MDIIPVPAFRDNYIWLAHDGRHALVVDPGDAAPVLDTLGRLGLQLGAILLTHHHADHVGGVARLLAHSRVPVFGPAGEAIDDVSHPVFEGDEIQVPAPGIGFRVLDVPGHTADVVGMVMGQQDRAEPQAVAT